MEKKRDTGIKILSDNRQAGHLYFLSDRVEAGIVLSGTEVKSARDGKIQLNDAFGEVSSDDSVSAEDLFLPACRTASVTVRDSWGARGAEITAGDDVEAACAHAVDARDGAEQSLQDIEGRLRGAGIQRGLEVSSGGNRCPAGGTGANYGRQAAEGPEHVGRTDGPAAILPDVTHAEGPGDEEPDRHRADDVRGDDREGTGHDQRSSSGTIAR